MLTVERTSVAGSMQAACPPDDTPTKAKREKKQRRMAPSPDCASNASWRSRGPDKEEHYRDRGTETVIIAHQERSVCRRRNRARKTSTGKSTRFTTISQRPVADWLRRPHVSSGGVAAAGDTLTATVLLSQPQLKIVKGVAERSLGQVTLGADSVTLW
jgi:hypothetical protein